MSAPWSSRLPLAGLDWALERSPRATLLHLSGEIDSSSAPLFRTGLEAATADGTPLVVVDMALVSFLDSTGLAVLIAALQSLGAGRELAVARVPARMQRMLRVSALDALMTVHGVHEPWPWPDVPEPAVAGR